VAAVAIALAADKPVGRIVLERSPENAEVAWAHYRVSPAVRSKLEQPSKTDAKAIRDLLELRNQGEIHADNRVKCVGVWETVGSYGVPAGFHLGFIARFIAMERLGFHDTSFGTLNRRAHRDAKSATMKGHSRLT
jgi:hypothetical protein